MADIKLKDREALRQSEEGTAILATVSNETNTGLARKVTIPGMAEAQHRENPLVAVWERVTFFDGDATPEATNSDFSSTTHNLDYKAGSSGPRHNFTDGYQEFVFRFNYGSGAPDATDKKWAAFYRVPSIFIIDATETEPFVIDIGDSEVQSPGVRGIQGVAFAKNTDTRFKIARVLFRSNSSHPTISDESTLHLSKIEGLKLTYQPESI